MGYTTPSGLSTVEDKAKMASVPITFGAKSALLLQKFVPGICKFGNISDRFENYWKT